MASNARNKFGTITAALAVAALLGAGCGDDDEDAGGASGTEEETTTTAAAGDDLDQLCALAATLFEQDEFPSADQIRSYQELAPPELRDAVETAGAAVTEHEGDFVATFAAFAEDDVEVALAEINTFENDTCNTGHDEADTVPPV